MSKQLIDDNQLVFMYMSGDESALAELVTRHKRRVYSSIYLIVRNKELTEDIFQDTFFKVINSLKAGNYYEDGKFLPWVIRIARNLVIDHFRKVKLMPMQHDTEEFSMFDIIPANSRNAVEQMIYDEKIAMVRGLLDKLPHEQREVVILRHYAGLSFKEISKMLDININTALGRMHYAILKMREMVESSPVSLKD